MKRAEHTQLPSSPYGYIRTCSLGLFSDLHRGLPFQTSYVVCLFFHFSLFSLFFWPFGVKVINLPLFFFQDFFFNLLLNVLSMDSGGTYTQQLHTVPALGMYPPVRQYSHLQINRTSKKYSGCKGIMHKAHKKLK